jgi:antitoxin HicB
MERKSLEYYLDLKYPFKIETLSEEDGGGYAITYPDLLGCISDGEAIDEAIVNGEDARRAWIEVAYEKGMEIPEPNSQDNKFSGRITLRTPRSLHRELVSHAEKEGVSLNQYIVYLLSRDISNHNI